MNMNGWNNEETANFMLWHADDIEAYIEKYVSHFATLDQAELADDIESFSYRLVGLNALPIGYVRETAAHSFNQISFNQIARHYQPIIDTAMTNAEIEIR
jgi:hypothetical protein